jgi:hypothetical protein
MSLESKIELLTAAIDRLTAMLEKQPQPVKVEAPLAAVKHHEAPETKADATTITIESLQTLCMEKVRKDRANTAKVKEILGGRLVKNVPAAEYVAVKQALEAL